MKYVPKTKPYKHQVKAIRRALRQGHIALLWEPGTGKSKAIVDWTSCLFLRSEASALKVLIFCPLSVVSVWEDEYEAHCPVEYRVKALAPTDGALPVFGRKRKIQVLVVNYDLAWRRENILDGFVPDVVIADESHRIKKPSARRSRFTRRFNRAPHRAILTGTPTPKSYLDIYAQWVFLNPKRFGTSVSNFKDRYIRFGGYFQRQVMGYKHFDELKQNIARDASIVRKDEVLDLPPRTYARVRVLLEDDAWTAYYKMAYELFLELTSSETVDAKNVAVKLLRLQQITGGFIKSEQGNVHQLSNAKMAATRQILEDLFEQDERVVVFARFRPEVLALCQLGARFRVPTYRLDGTTGRDERTDIRKQFQTQAGPSLFVAQIQSGGLGITLHSSCEVVFYSVTYALDDYIQACDRVHRIGQDRPVTYRHMVATNTVDLDIYASLRQKEDIMATIMGSPQGRRRIASSLANSLGLTGKSH